MAARGRHPPILRDREVEASRSMHRSLPSSHQLRDSLPSPDRLESRIAAQAGEIEQLAGDNQILAATHLTLRQDVAAAQQEVERLQAHIRSIHTESDIQIRMLLDKIGKMESNNSAGEHVKQDLQLAHTEAQSLVKARQELTSQIQDASRELANVRADMKTLPDLLNKLKNLRNEHQRLRTTFEYQKCLNMEKADHLRRMEHNLIGMAREIETLQSEVFKAEARARAPNAYLGGHAGPAPYPHPVHTARMYTDASGRAPMQMVVGSKGMNLLPGQPGTSIAGDSIYGGAAYPLTS